MRALAARLRPSRLFPDRLPSLTLSRHARRRLALVLAVVILLASAYWFWFRDSGLVKVDRVSVSGLTGKQAPAVRAALTAAAGRMTTLHVDEGRLERAVERFPIVAGIEAKPDFPGTLRIEVTERTPAAVLAAAGGKPVTVASDGVVLGPPSRSLPELPFKVGIGAKRVTAPEVLPLVAVSGAAPSGLRAEIESVTRTAANGIVVKLGDGVPELRFGDERRARAKWAAAAALLADPEVSDGAYIDLRLPDRPAVGGLGPKAAPVEPGTGGFTPDQGVPDQGVPQQTVPQQQATPAEPVVPAQ